MEGTVLAEASVNVGMLVLGACCEKLLTKP